MASKKLFAAMLVIVWGMDKFIAGGTDGKLWYSNQ